jgi:hypothetical protein
MAAQQQRHDLARSDLPRPVGHNQHAAACHWLLPHGLGRLACAPVQKPSALLSM